VPKVVRISRFLIFQKPSLPEDVLRKFPAIVEHELDRASAASAPPEDGEVLLVLFRSNARRVLGQQRQLG
jgi:hypothetical protein